MDTPTIRDRQILEAALTRAAALGVDLRAAPTRRPGAETTLDLRLNGPRRLRYAAEVRRHLRPGTLGAVLERLRQRAGKDRPFLILDQITPQLADDLRQRGVEFLDAAGNAFLHEPPHLHLFVKGEKGDLRLPGDEPARAFKPAGLQVIFTLLARKGFETRPYREIAAAAGVATGVVGNVMAELPQLGFLTEIAGTRRLLDRTRLTDQWTEAYARALRPKLLLGRFAGDTVLIRPPVTEALDAVLGGEVAAAILTDHLRPATATVYAERIDPALVARYRLRADPKGAVDIRRRFWRFDAEERDLAPPLLVYADLIAIGDDRCLETARILRKRLLD